MLLVSFLAVNRSVQPLWLAAAGVHVPPLMAAPGIAIIERRLKHAFLSSCELWRPTPTGDDQLTLSLTSLCTLLRSFTDVLSVRWRGNVKGLLLRRTSVTSSHQFLHGAFHVDVVRAIFQDGQPLDPISGLDWSALCQYVFTEFRRRAIRAALQVATLPPAPAASGHQVAVIDPGHQHILALRDMSRDQLHAQVLLLTQQNTRLKKDVKSFRQQVKRLEDKISSSEARLKVSQSGDEKNAALQIQRLGKVKLSSGGVCAVGLRRNFGNVAALDFGSTTLDKVSRQTVVRAEIDTSAAYLAAVRAAHLDSASIIRDLLPTEGRRDDDDPLLLLCLHSVRSDATNSCVWQDSKLQACEVESGYMLDSDAAMQYGVLSTWHQFRCMADMQKVEDASGVPLRVQHRIVFRRTTSHRCQSITCTCSRDS